MEKARAVFKIKKLQEGLAIGVAGLLVLLYCTAEQLSFGGSLWQSPFLFAGLGGLVLLALGGVLLRQALPELAAVTEHPLTPVMPDSGWQVAAMVALTVAYCLMMPVLGFLLCTALYLMALLWLLGESSLPLLLAVSACTSAAVYLLFGLVLGVLLP